LKLHLLVRLLLLGIIMAPAMSHAEISCPWLNRATAAGVLGGPASLKVQSTAAEDICLFQYQRGTMSYDLQIVVDDIDLPARGAAPAPSRCSSQAIPLKGIGNEATMCGVDFSSFHGERVAGRVRDREFVIRLGSSVKKDPAMTNEMLQLKARGVAEQVAGSLF